MRSQNSIVIIAILSTAGCINAKPDTGYGAPVEQEYGPPPAESYGAPAPAYNNAPAPLDLTTLIIPILALVGLFLLFPTYVTLTSVRRKREVGDEPSLTEDLVARIQDTYNAVLESEECMERVACQVGAMARDAGLSRSLSASALLMTPVKYSKYAKRFALPSDCSKIKCGNLF